MGLLVSIPKKFWVFAGIFLGFMGFFCSAQAQKLFCTSCDTSDEWWSL
jgi:hypothetical protein